MATKKSTLTVTRTATEDVPRRKRADAQQKMVSLLHAAADVFAESGVDAPVRDIAERAGVGLGTVYRHFPQRSDLIAAVFQAQIDTCADAAAQLTRQYEPFDALGRWMKQYVGLITKKKGLAAALHSGDPAYSALPDYFDKPLRPVLQTLLDASVAAKSIRSGTKADELLLAVATLCNVPRGAEPGYTARMVALLLDGLRYSTGQV